MNVRSVRECPQANGHVRPRSIPIREWSGQSRPDKVSYSSNPTSSYRRCPTCGAIARNGIYAVHRHRPQCPFDGTDAREWI